MKLLQHTYVLISLVAVIAVIPLSKISGTKNTSIPVKVSKKTGVIKDISRKKATPAAYYNENDNSWLFSAQVLEIKDVSIYGRPGSIAMIEYVHEGDVHKGWAVLKIDDYAFSGSSSDITVGDHLILLVSGNYVLSNGVDWNACPGNDTFCQHAGFIEGGFPTSEDYGGLMISPSNTLIYSGSLEDDWINGMLAWRIISED